MDHLTMKELYEYNTNYPRTSESRPLKRKGDHSTEWGGYKTRVMLEALYTTSMKCLLRFEEALRIQWADIDFVVINGHNCVRLKLPFRKTHQLGGALLLSCAPTRITDPSASEIYPFLIYEDLDRPWMDPVAALAEWWILSGQMQLDRSGFVFRSRRHGSDEVSALAGARMVCPLMIRCVSPAHQLSIVDEELPAMLPKQPH